MMQLEQNIPASALVRVYLLGPLEISRRDTSGTWKLVPKDKWKNSKPARTTLKRLLVQPGRRLSREQLADDVWSESSAEPDVYNAISLVRGVIGKPLVKLWTSAYEIAGQALVWTDIDASEALLKEAENQEHTSIQAFPLLEQALTLLERGELLEGEYGTWCHAFRKRAEDMLRQTRLWLAESYETQGKVWQAGEQYRAMVLRDPSDEEALQRWLEMLFRHGKRREALKCYQNMKDFMEAQGYVLSFTIGQFIDSCIREIRSQQESLFLPDRTALLWLPDQRNPETYPRFAVWPTLLQERSEELAKAQEILYIYPEVEIIAMTLQWRWSSDPIVLLQQLAYDSIRKYDEMHKDHSDHNAKITRRHALEAIAMFPIQMYSLTHLVSEVRPIPLNQVLPSCAAGITACWELRRYESDGLLTIQRILSVYLPLLENVARQSSSYQSAAACLASQGYLLVNILAEHYGKSDQIGTAARQARFYGQLAQDVNLEVSALVRLAIKFDYEHNDMKALETYQEAMALPGFSTVSPLLQGRVYAGLAGTHAYCSQTAQALSFLSQAKEIYPNEPASDPTYPFAICDSNTLALWEGLTLKHTNNCADAFSAFTRFGKLTPLPNLLELNRVEHLNYAASVAIKQRNLDAAALYLDIAEGVAWQIQDATRLSEVCDSLRSIRLVWPNEAKVKTLQEKFYTRQSHQTH